MKKHIRAPSGLPFSKAIIHDDRYTMEISGQVGLDAEGKLVKGIEAQTIQTLDNVKAILEEVGWSFDNLIKVRIFLSDISDYAKVNDIYSKYFNDNFPTRVAVSVKDLPLGALIELDCTASGNKVKN